MPQNKLKNSTAKKKRDEGNDLAYQDWRAKKLHHRERDLVVAQLR